MFFAINCIIGHLAARTQIAATLPACLCRISRRPNEKYWKVKKENYLRLQHVRYLRRISTRRCQKITSNCPICRWRSLPWGNIVIHQSFHHTWTICLRNTTWKPIAVERRNQMITDQALIWSQCLDSPVSSHIIVTKAGVLSSQLIQALFRKWKWKKVSLCQPF